MTITLIQMDIVWGDIATNCQEASHLIDQSPGSMLYVLPEMFSTGFATEPEGLADTDGTTLVWMMSKSQSTGAAICGSVAIRTSEGHYRNRFYFVRPTDRSPHKVACYDKHHLFTYGGEHHHYTAGQERVEVEWQGRRFLLQVCYDLRFPTFARNSAAQPYDAIIYVASWPQTRQRVWEALLTARAIENQSYVLGVNRVGQDFLCQYSGGTRLIDSYGEIVCGAPLGEVAAVSYVLDFEKQDKFRQKFPVLYDAD